MADGWTRLSSFVGPWRENQTTWWPAHQWAGPSHPGNRQYWSRATAVVSGRARVQFRRHAAGHAFSNWDAPSMYNEAAAGEAWERTIAFLRVEGVDAVHGEAPVDDGAALLGITL